MLEERLDEKGYKQSNKLNFKIHLQKPVSSFYIYIRLRQFQIIA